MASFIWITINIHKRLWYKRLQWLQCMQPNQEYLVPMRIIASSSKQFPFDTSASGVSFELCTRQNSRKSRNEKRSWCVTLGAWTNNTRKNHYESPLYCCHEPLWKRTYSASVKATIKQWFAGDESVPLKSLCRKTPDKVGVLGWEMCLSRCEWNAAAGSVKGYELMLSE